MSRARASTRTPACATRAEARAPALYRHGHAVQHGRGRRPERGGRVRGGRRPERLYASCAWSGRLADGKGGGGLGHAGARARAMRCSRSRPHATPISARRAPRRSCPRACSCATSGSSSFPNSASSRSSTPATRSRCSPTRTPVLPRPRSVFRRRAFLRVSPRRWAVGRRSGNWLVRYVRGRRAGVEGRWGGGGKAGRGMAKRKRCGRI